MFYSIIFYLTFIESVYMGKIFIIIGVFIIIIGLMIQLGGDKLGWFGD